MDRFNYYLGKDYLPEDANEKQLVIQDAIRRQLAKRNIFGITSGAAYTAVAGTGFRLQFNSGGSLNLQGFCPGAHRVNLGANPYVTPDLSGAFTLPTAPNTKWLTVFLKYAEVESQPERTEITYVDVNFRISESFELEVVSGAEGNPPTKPVLDEANNPDRIYLCDILVNETDTDFTTSTIEIDPARKAIDPFAEVAERALGFGDRLGSEAVLALIGGDSALRFRDVKDSSPNFESALLGALGAGATGANRLALLSDLPSGVLGNYHSLNGGVSIYDSPGVVAIGGQYILTSWLAALGMTVPTLVVVKGLSVTGLFGLGIIGSTVSAMSPSEYGTAPWPPPSGYFGGGIDARTVAASGGSSISGTLTDSVDTGIGLVIPELVSGEWRISWYVQSGPYGNFNQKLTLCGMFGY